MERESRESESDLLSPLRRQTQEEDVGEQLRNLELNPPSLVLIPVGDRTSPETHLENYMRCIEAGWTPKDARGQSGDKNYYVLAKLRKSDSNPYDKDPPPGKTFYRKDGKGHLRDAWRHLKDNWEVLDPKSHADPLRNVPRELRDALMDIIDNPETPREEKLAELYNKISTSSRNTTTTTSRKMFIAVRDFVREYKHF